MGSSKNLMLSRCAVYLFGRLHINFAGCGLPVADVAQQQHRPRRLGTVPDGSRDYTDVCQEILGNMTDEDAVQMGGRRFLEVPLIYNRKYQVEDHHERRCEYYAVEAVEYTAMPRDK